jgi:hypothetical protein
MNWYLRKHDGGQLYECDALDELRTWANAAQVNPFDDISTDGVNWRPAFEIPELGMFWMVTLANGASYGPTNIPTLREFITAKLLPPEAVCTHRISNQRVIAQDLIDGTWGTSKAALPKPIITGPPPQEDPKPTRPEGPIRSGANDMSFKTKRLTSRLMARLQPEWKTDPLPMPATEPPPLPVGTIIPPEPNH